MRQHRYSATLRSLLVLGCSALVAACGSDKPTLSSGETPDASSPLTDAELVAQHCSLDTTVTSYTAGPGSSSPSADSGGKLVSCYQEFHLGGGEPTLVVSKDGSVTYAPIFTTDGVGLARTTDSGATWTDLVPKFPDGGGHGRQQPYLFRDPATDRVFFTTTTTGAGGSTATAGFDMTRSDNGFATYTYSNVATDASDWLKMYAGPPVTSKPVGSSNVIYMSAPSPISTLNGVYQAVYKSTDAGATFQSVGGKSLSLKVSDYPDCPADGWVIFGNGGVGPDGTVYISLHRCGHLAVASSGDEGETWSMVDVPGTTLLPFIGLAQEIARANALLTEPLAVDEDGTVYMVWLDEAGLLQFAISKDKAKTWSASVVVSDPSIDYAVYGGIAIRAPGKFGIAYYGSSGGEAGPFGGYVAETTNGLEAAPRFRSVRVDDPSHPLMPGAFDVGYGRLFSGGELNEIVKPAYAPNGDLWASFARDMCLGLGSETDQCDWDVAANGNSFYQASVARVVHR